jgi:hypothetical protein
MGKLGKQEKGHEGIVLTGSIGSQLGVDNAYLRKLG